MTRETKIVLLQLVMERLDELEHSTISEEEREARRKELVAVRQELSNA